jgi:hypothetical protein
MATLRSRVWRAPRCSADDPSADSREPAAARARAPQPGRAAPTLAGRLSPLPAHKRAMPAQQRPRRDHARAARGARQVAGRPSEQGTIRGTKGRPRHLAAQHLELVAKDEQLDVVDVQTAATANERSQQRPEREVEKREGHGRRSSQPARHGRDTSIGTLQAQGGRPGRLGIHGGGRALAALSDAWDARVLRGLAGAGTRSDRPRARPADADRRRRRPPD